MFGGINDDKNNNNLTMDEFVAFNFSLFNSFGKQMCVVCVCVCALCMYPVLVFVCVVFS